MNPGYYRNGEFGYGYMWWVWEQYGADDILQGAYSARGAYGQFITVIPKLDMVIAHKVAVPPYENIYWSQFREIINKLAEARP